MQFKYNTPLFLWVMATLMIAMFLGIAGTFIFGNVSEEPMIKAAVVAVSLAFANGIGCALYSKPCVSLSLEATGIRLVLRYPLKTLRLNYPHDQVRDMRIVESVDSEGDPHFTTRITMADGRDIDLADGARDCCEPVLTQFTNALSNYAKATTPPTEA